MRGGIRHTHLKYNPCLTVIPAKAGTRGEHMDVLGVEERGIQFKYASEGHKTAFECFSRRI